MIYKFRVILDTEEDIFRDIAIESENTLEDLHNAIVNAFGFDGSEGASFYTCDDNWVQDKEIPLFDMGEDDENLSMANYILEDNLDDYSRKLIYVYDYFNMWTFLVELAAIDEAKEEHLLYPALLFSHGILPADPPDNGFKTDDLKGFSNEYNDFGEGHDDDDLDNLDDLDAGHYDDYGFEENWN